MERKWALRGQLKYSLSIQCQGGLQVPNSLVLAIGGTGGNRTLVQFTVMTLRCKYTKPLTLLQGVGLLMLSGVGLLEGDHQFSIERLRNS